MHCTGCGTAATPGARFCAGCGAALGGPALGAPVAAAHEERRLVTIVFCDLVGSTSLSGRLDPETLRAVTFRYFELMRGCVEAHGGVVEKFIGDAVMAAFGVPALHEDDPRRALAAARDMLEALEEYNAELAAGPGIRLDVRIGVNTGEVVTTPDTSSGHGYVSGEAVNVAARLEQNAGPGQILVGPRTVAAVGAAAVVEPAGELLLRGKADPVTAYALLGIGPDDPEVVRRFDAPFVGREPELAELSVILDRVRRQERGQLVSVYGDAGIGKTRLVRTWLADRPDPVGVHAGTGRCRPYGEAGTLAPLAEAVAALVEAHPGIAVPPILRDGLLRDGSPTPSLVETVAAVGDVLTATPAATVLVLDDCHWATAALLDVVEEIVDRTAQDPVLVVCLARPDLLQHRPGWGGGRLNAGSLVLGPLSEAEAGELAAGLVEVGAHAAGTLAVAVERAEGNPLHLEHLVAALLQDTGSQPLPPSVHALLAARIDGLAPAERVVLERAAVIGRDFAVGTLQALEPDADPLAALRHLTQRRLVEPVRGRRSEFRFSSALIQEVAYLGMAKRTRADLHARLADAATEAATVAGHLEAAHQYLTELGVPESGRADLRRRAAAALVGAGTTALTRCDLAWAADLLRRAVDLHRPGEAGRAGAVRHLGEALLALGRVDEGTSLLRDVLADPLTDASTVAHARLLLSAHDPGGRLADGSAAAATARSVLPVFEAADDRLGLARATIRLAQEQQFEGRHEQATALLDRGLEQAVSAGAEAERAVALGAVGVSLWLGPVPVGAALERCRSLLAEHGEGRRAVQATLSCPLAVLLAVQGDVAAARARFEEATRVARDLGYAEAEAFLPVFGAQIEVLAGEPAQAEALLRQALAAARLTGSAALVATASRDLARLVLDRGDRAQARELLGAPEDLPPAEAADDAGLRARVAAHDGAAVEAREWALRAVTSAGRTDSPLGRGFADLDRAHVDLVTGHHRDAVRSAESAAAWFAAKEHPVAVGWCVDLAARATWEGRP